MIPHIESSVLVDRRVRGFPDRSFGDLTVAEQDIGAVVGADAARVQGDADAAQMP